MHRCSRGFILLHLLMTFGLATAARADSSGFPLISPPIPFPRFELGSLDNKLTGSYLHITDQTASFGGGSVDYKGRYAPFSWLAVGLELPVIYLTGNLGAVGNNGDESYWTLAPVLNLQVQVVNSPDFSLLLFGGYNLTYGNGSVDETDQGQEANLDFSAITRGYTVGAQAGIPLGHGIVFAPSYMFTRNYGGTMSTTITLVGVPMPPMTDSMPIGGFTSHAVGFDIILPQPWLSIGALVHQLVKSQDAGEAVRVAMLQLAYHFGDVKPFN